MIYYNEAGQVLPADEIDLDKGYLVDKDTVEHLAEYREEIYTSSKGEPLPCRILSKAAYTEVVSQTYILYADHPTRQDELEAALTELAAMVADNAQRLDEQEAALVDVAAVAAGKEE